jgi:hypothetical protein
VVRQVREEAKYDTMTGATAIDVCARLASSEKYGGRVMSETGGDKSWKQHLASGQSWWRLPFMILFGVVFNIVAWLVAIVALFQFIHTLFTGVANQRVLGFSASLGAYIEQLVNYLIYQTERKPFPFADWPSVRPPPARTAPRTNTPVTPASGGTASQDEAQGSSSQGPSSQGPSSTERTDDT